MSDNKPGEAEQGDPLIAKPPACCGGACLPRSRSGGDVLDVLMDEYKRATKSIEYSFSQSYKLSTVWLGLVGAVFGIGKRFSAPAAYLMVPFITILLLFYTVNVYEGIMTTGGYVAGLETRINKHLRKRVLSWESEICPDHCHRKESMEWFTRTLIVTALLVTAASLIQIADLVVLRYPLLISIVLGILVTAAIRKAYVLNRRAEATHEKVHAHYISWSRRQSRESEINPRPQSEGSSR